MAILPCLRLRFQRPQATDTGDTFHARRVNAMPQRSRRTQSRSVAVMLCALLSAGQAALAQPRTVPARRERTLASLPFDSSVARSVVVSPDGTRGAYVKPLKGGSLAVVIDGNAS